MAVYLKSTRRTPTYASALPHTDARSNARGTDSTTTPGPRPIAQHAETDRDRLGTHATGYAHAGIHRGIIPMLPRSPRGPPTPTAIRDDASLVHHRTRNVERTSTIPDKSASSVRCSHERHPLHQLAHDHRYPGTQHHRRYVVHLLDVCTVTALIVKQALSDSIANRGRELSWGPNTLATHLKPEPFAHGQHHATPRRPNKL